jgi:hypothetical protein
MYLSRQAWIASRQRSAAAAHRENPTSHGKPRGAARGAAHSTPMVAAPILLIRSQLDPPPASSA